MSCWPCENVRTMLDLTGFSNFTSKGYYQSGVPFIVRDAQRRGVTLQNIYQLLQQNNLEKAPHLLQSLFPSPNPPIQNFHQLLHHHQFEKELQVIWKVNRAPYARLLRTLFTRPYYIPPETEISVQHFLFIDQQQAPGYQLPITEFANVFLIQGEGPRLVVLYPVRHCQQVCKPIRVLLQPRDVRKSIPEFKFIPILSSNRLSFKVVIIFFLHSLLQLAILESCCDPGAHQPGSG